MNSRSEQNKMALTSVRTRLWAAGSVLLVSAAVGLWLTSSSAAGTSVAEKPTSQVATRTDWVSRLPTGVYFTSLSDARMQQVAIDALAVKCMKGFGINYTPPVEPVVNDAILDSRRYGLTNLGDAQHYGYHLPSDALWSSTSISSGDGLGAQAEVVLNGAPIGHNGPISSPMVRNKPVPVAGCSGWAARQLGGGTAVGLERSATAATIMDYSFHYSLSDPRMTAAFAAWASCMSTKGHSYKTPMASIADPAWRGTVSAHEIETAVDDVNCAAQTSLDTTWSDVERSLQVSKVKAYAADLDSDKTVRVRALSRIITLVDAKTGLAK